MKPFKNFLHILLTITSLFAFVGGWITFAHSRKPIQPASRQDTTLQPLPTLEPMYGETASNNGSMFSFLTPARRRRVSRPNFRTGGS
jgi:hypothetical protein